MERIERKRVKINEKKLISRNKEKEEVLGDDRISHLPDPILHNIISILPKRDAAQTSILSKRWGHLWHTYPIIDLDEICMRLCLSKRVKEVREVFLNSIRKTLAKHDLQDLQMLRISTISLRDKELDVPVNELIALSVTTGKVRVLDLNFSTEGHLNDEENCSKCYILPEIVFSSGSSLVCLMLEGCQFEPYDTINFLSLKKLSMRNVHIPDQMLPKLILACPLIDYLELTYCHGIRTLRVSNSHLKCLIVMCCKEIKAFDINAPNLQYFTYRGDFILYNEGKMEISLFQPSCVSSFNSLSTLYLSYVKMRVEQFERMMSNCPNLENLSLLLCTFQKSPRINCTKLKKFAIVNCNLPEEVTIIAPNLQTFYLGCSTSGFLSTCIGFKGLKSLILEENIEIDDELLQLIISFISLLEILDLKYCTSFKHLNIFSQTLKGLIVKNCWDVEDGEIEAPNLVFFKYGGKMLELSRVSTSELLNTELELEEFDQLDSSDLGKLRNIVSKFEHVKDIKVVSKHSEVLIDSYGRGVLPLLPYTRHLKLKILVEKTGYINVLSTVLCTPFCRHSLFMDLDSRAIMLKFQDLPDRINLYSQNFQSIFHDCVRHHLIDLRMEKFDGSNAEMDLLEFLLGRAVVLKSVFISFKRKCRRHRSVIMHRIKCYHKASPSFDIVYS